MFMRYEYDHGYNLDTQKNNEIGNDKFIRPGMRLSYEIAWEPIEAKDVYICPKCGTLKIDI